MTRSLFIFFCLASFCFGKEVYAQKSVGIGTTSPNQNAALHIVSPTNDQGLMVPKLNTAQRLAIPAMSPVDDGLLVFDLSENSFYYWKESAWHKDFGSTLQTLNFDVATNLLTISDGNMVDLSSLAAGGTDDQSLSQFSLNGTFNERLTILLEDDPAGSKSVDLHSLTFLPTSDLTNTLGDATIKNDVIGTSNLVDGAVTDVKITSVDPSKILGGGATINQILKWNGTAWVPNNENVPVAVPITSFESIDPGDFIQVLLDNTSLDRNHLLIFKSDNTFVSVEEPATGSTIMAPVHLPHGARLTAVTVYYADQSINDIRLDLLRKPFAGPNESVLTTTWTSSGNSAAIQSATLTSFDFPFIDNQNFTYRVVIDINYGIGKAKDPSETLHRIYGLKIEYIEP